MQRQEISADQLGAAEGRALEAAGGAVQNAGMVVAKRLDQENTSDVTAKLAKANADLAIDLQQTIRTAEPGDKKVFEDYNKRVEDTMGKIGEEASTESARAYFSEASSRIKGTLSKTSADGQAELSGIKAVQDYTSTLNNLSTASMADPSSAQLQKDLHKQALENLVKTGALPREKALQLETQGNMNLAKASVRGWIELNPEYAKQKLKEGAFDQDLGADGKAQLFGEADQAIRGKEIEQERRERQMEKVQAKQRQVTQNTFLSKMEKGELSSKDILNSNLEAFGSGSKEQFLGMMKKLNSPDEKLKTDPQVMIGLYNRIHLPDGDPNKLFDENELNNHFGNGLSWADLGRLRDEMQGSQTEEGKHANDMKKQLFEVAKGKLTKSNPMTGFKDPQGDENMTRFMGQFYDEYKMARAKGKTDRELLSPDSPDYLGKSISMYQRTPQQIMRDLVPKRQPAPGLAVTPQVEGANAAAPGTAPNLYRAPAPPAALPRQPGESPAAYLKRTKGGG